MIPQSEASRLSSIAFVATIVVVIVIIAVIGFSQSPSSVSATSTSAPSSLESSTSTDIGFIATRTLPCNAPGVYCGPGFTISNSSLISASTIGKNYSILYFMVYGTYSDLKTASLSIWLSNANSSEPNGSNGAHLVAKVIPSWSGEDGSSYSFNVPMTGFRAIKGAQCELWIDAYSALGPLKGDNWAMQNMTIG